MNRKGPIAILLLLCFSVVLIHSMVPHHHHHGVVAESSASCCDDHHNTTNSHSTQSHQSPHSSQGSHDHQGPCNHSNHNSHHTPAGSNLPHDPCYHLEAQNLQDTHDQCSCDTHPQHCDAFNDINFFKSSGSRIDGPPAVNSLFLIAPGSTMLQLTDRSTGPGYFVPRTTQHIACPTGRSTSLRGPPSTSRIPA